MGSLRKRIGYISFTMIALVTAGSAIMVQSTNSQTDVSAATKTTGFKYLANQHKTVYYNGKGQMQYGVQKINGHWYQFDKKTGGMFTGFHWYKNRTVYYNGNGQMQYGIKKINGHWYQFDKKSGGMFTGFHWYQNRTVYYNGNGQMQYGIKKINGHWYQFDKKSGGMMTGFHWYKNRTVYYNAQGQMQYGWKTINGYRYYFNTSSGGQEQKVAVNSEASLVTNSKVAKKAQQIVTVVQNGSTTATLHLWKKNGRTWQNKMTVKSTIGSSGIGYSKEGSSKTPIGSYHLSYAFGKAGSVRTSGMSYRQIKSNSYWIEDQKDKQYNTWQNRSWANSKNEHLINYTKAAPHNQYELAVVMDNHGQNNGSGFFIHVKNQWPTEGCVSIDLGSMKNLVSQLGKNAYVVNVQSLNQLKNY